MKILSIQSEVAAGHVGNSAARFALQRLGIEVIALPAVVLSNHAGYAKVAGRTIPAAELEAMLEALEANGFLAGCGAVISGYLGEAAQSGIVREAVLSVKRANPAAFYLCDPVFGDEGGAYAKPGVAEAMARKLVPIADIVTPNRYELQSLTSRTVRTPEDAVAAARLLGRKAVLATSIPCPEGLATVLAEPASAAMTVTRRLANPPHGSGDLLAALFAGHSLAGRSPREALAHAAASVDALLADADGRAEMRLAAMQDALVTAEPLALQDLS